MKDIHWNRGALEELASSDAMRNMLHKAGNAVRDTARANVQSHYPGTQRARAIWTESGTDAESAYADVGYRRSSPGWVLFYSEIGTSLMSPRPHLRAALDQTRF